MPVQSVKSRVDLVDRLSRSFAKSDRAAKLDLPKDVYHLMDLFLQFETNLRMLKQRKGPWQSTLEAVAKGIEATMGRQFNEDRFRQMLSVAPDFYLHRWEVR